MGLAGIGIFYFPVKKKNLPKPIGSLADVWTIAIDVVTRYLNGTCLMKIVAKYYYNNSRKTNQKSSDLLGNVFRMIVQMHLVAS